MPSYRSPFRRTLRHLLLPARLALSAVAALLTLAAPYASHAEPGDLDATFGTITTGFGSNTGEGGYSVAVQRDGKIVVVGYAWNGSNSDFALVRYNTDGTLDTSFGSDGTATTAFGNGGNNVAQSVVVQADGKIVVAGYAWNGSNLDFALVRYNADGMLDTSFGSGGKVTTNFSGEDRGCGVAVQTDGKIVVAGYTQNTFSYDFAVVRYTASGALDTSFGGGTGKVTTDFGIGGDAASSVAVQADGKIVVAGHAQSEFSYDFAVVRYTASGTLDTSFGSGGKVTTAIGYENSAAYSVAVQADGKIVVTGTSWADESSDFALARYTASGALDTSFGGGTGKVITDFGGADYGFSMAVQADGKIVVAGITAPGTGSSDFALARYTATGALDTNFGGGSGKVSTSFGIGTGDGRSVAVQADGKIVVAGNSWNGSNYDFALARYEGTAMRSGFDTAELARNDDGSTTNAVPIGFSISLFGQTYSSCWVNNNGNITFDDALWAFTPEPLQSIGFPMIAAFWADVDTRPDPGSDVVRYGTGLVNGRPAFGVNYINVGYYAYHTEKLNNLQLLLIERSDTGTGNFDVEFNYGQVRWETGDASYGTDGYGGFPCRVGITNGSNRTIELTNSGISEAFLDTILDTGAPNYASGLIYQTRNSTVPGRLVFQVRGGQVLGSLEVNAGADQYISAPQTTTTLAGIAQDPNGGSVTVTWAVLDGTGVTISDPHSLTPTVTLPENGTYVLQLTVTSVTDPQISAADTIIIDRY